jgi:phosphonoacetate hydrolase
MNTMRPTSPCVEASFTVNGRTYHVPDRPLAVICLDGCADEYLDAALAHGRMPNVARLARTGYRGLVRGALPSFTNVNNCAIVTGTPPCDTGIGGNYFLDPATGQEVMSNSSKYLRNETILAAAARAGRKVAVVTAKDKLRELLSASGTRHPAANAARLAAQLGSPGLIAFSAEKANQYTAAGAGVAEALALTGPAPPIYSADASLYVLRAGCALLQAGLADFCYLTTTDYLQHKYAPATPEALAFHEALDHEIGRLLDLGAVVGITADHGMNAKCDAQGQPHVVYLETLLAERFSDCSIRVICPITDPYVVHHGALGSAVTVYLSDPGRCTEVARWVLDLDGITEVYDRETAARKLELPADRIGDLFVLAGRDWVIGRTPAYHDLAQLEGRPLRSHGGRYEEMVPMILSEPLNDTFAARAAGDPRNFDIFDFTCNGASAR